MSPFDPKSPPEGARPPQTFDTAGGVRVRVKAPPPPEPIPAPAPPEQIPRMVIRPPALTKKERDAIIRRLYKEQRQFLRDLVLCQAGIGPESKKDLQQRVLMALTAHVENHRGPPTNPRGFLRRVVKNEVCDHWKERRVEVQYGADPDAELSPAPDPEGTAELAEKRAKLERYLCLLTPKEAQVVRCLDLFDLTIKQTAKAVGLPDGTVATVHARAVKKLEALGAASERGTLLGRSG